MKRWAVAVLLAVLLVGCNVILQETPQPIASPIPTPGVMLTREYLPLIVHRYPGTARGVTGGLWGVLDAPYHHWTISPMNADRRFVRTVWCVDDWHLNLYEPDIALAATADYQAGITGRAWLLLNEPDDRSGKTPPNGQCGIYPLTGNPFDPANPALTVFENPEETARRTIAIYNLIRRHDPRARIFVGGIGWPGFQETRDWWARFVAEFARRGELGKLTHIHFHAYPYGSFHTGGMQAFKDGVRAWVKFNKAQGAPTSEYWITETGGGPCDRWQRWDAAAYTTIRDETMTPMEQWMDATAPKLGITRVYWFVSWAGLEASWWCNYLIDARETPVKTALGEKWH